MPPNRFLKFCILVSLSFMCNLLNKNDYNGSPSDTTKRICWTGSKPWHPLFDGVLPLQSLSPLQKPPQLPRFKKWKSKQRKEPWLSPTPHPDCHEKPGKIRGDSSGHLCTTGETKHPVTKESQPNQSNFLQVTQFLQELVAMIFWSNWLCLSLFVIKWLFISEFLEGWEGNARSQNLLWVLHQSSYLRKPTLPGNIKNY